MTSSLSVYIVSHHHMSHVLIIIAGLGIIAMLVMYPTTQATYLNYLIHHFVLHQQAISSYWSSPTHVLCYNIIELVSVSSFFKVNIQVQLFKFIIFLLVPCNFLLFFQTDLSTLQTRPAHPLNCHTFASYQVFKARNSVKLK